MAMIGAPRGNPEYVRLSGMAVRLYRFMSPLGFGAVVFGSAIPFAAGWWGSGWGTCQTVFGVDALGLSAVLRRAAASFSELQQYFLTPLVSRI